MDSVLAHTFRSLTVSWENLLLKLRDHFSLIEEKVYENPADGSRAPELWINAALRLRIQKLLSLQVATLRSIQGSLKELSLEDFEYLREATSQLSRIPDLLKEELINPTTNFDVSSKS
jgi:hypothetical protein